MVGSIHGLDQLDQAVMVAVLPFPRTVAMVHYLTRGCVSSWIKAVRLDVRQGLINRVFDGMDRMVGKVTRLC